MGSGVAVHAGAQHGGLVALVGIGHGKGEGFLDGVSFIVIEVLVEVSCGNEHQVGIRCHTAKSLRREGACCNGCGVGAVVFTAHIGGQTGYELRRVEHRTGEGVVSGLGVAHGELAALVAVVQIDTLDAAAALAVLEGWVLEVDADVDEADVHALARVEGGAVGQRGAVQQADTRGLAGLVGLQPALVARVDAQHALNALQCGHAVGGNAHGGLLAQLRAHHGTGSLHLAEGLGSIFG